MFTITGWAGPLVDCPAFLRGKMMLKLFALSFAGIFINVVDGGSTILLLAYPSPSPSPSLLPSLSLSRSLPLAHRNKRWCASPKPGLRSRELLCLVLVWFVKLPTKLRTRSILFPIFPLTVLCDSGPSRDSRISCAGTIFGPHQINKSSRDVSVLVKIREI